MYKSSGPVDLQTNTMTIAATPETAVLYLQADGRPCVSDSQSLPVVIEIDLVSQLRPDINMADYTPKDGVVCQTTGNRWALEHHRFLAISPRANVGEDYFVPLNPVKGATDFTVSAVISLQENGDPEWFVFQICKAMDGTVTRYVDGELLTNDAGSPAEEFESRFQFPAEGNPSPSFALSSSALERTLDVAAALVFSKVLNEDERAAVDLHLYGRYIHQVIPQTAVDSNEELEPQCLVAEEATSGTIHCGFMKVIEYITMASYGTSAGGGTCQAEKIGECHAAASVTIAGQTCIGEQTCTLTASDQVFGEHCINPEVSGTQLVDAGVEFSKFGDGYCLETMMIPVAIQ